MVSAFQKITVIKSGEMHVSTLKPEVMVSSNISSGVVITLYDPARRIGALAHALLPDSRLATDGANNAEPALGKYVDQMVPTLLQEFMNADGNPKDSIVSLIGGAQLFNFGGGGGNILNVGARNVIAAQTMLQQFGLAVDYLDTGGNKTRTVHFQMENGDVRVQLVGGKEYILQSAGQDSKTSQDGKNS